jgi:K+-transporting ATPase ATPase C chain
MRLPAWISQHLAALRALLVFTVLVGLAYPLALVAIARIPGLSGNADGSLIERDGSAVGSSLIGQAFIDADGNPLPQYFQSRPSAAGDGYDPTSTSASNLGPEDIVDELPDPADPESGSPSLLTQVCAQSLAVGELENVDGGRPFCTGDGVGAVLAVFRTDGLTGAATRVVSLNQACPTAPFVARFEGVTVECANVGEDYSGGVVTPIRGNAPANPVVPPDAVTSSGSGLDPHISPAYARLQAPRVARERGVDVEVVQNLIEAHTTNRYLGFVGEPGVNVLELNIDLDAQHPVA